LNRAEYAQRDSDLLALGLIGNAAPPDDSADGFDSNADVLRVSPVLSSGIFRGGDHQCVGVGDPRSSLDRRPTAFAVTHRRQARTTRCHQGRAAV
jgi:hypothetical protein